MQDSALYIAAPSAIQHPQLPFKSPDVQRNRGRKSVYFVRTLQAVCPTSLLAYTTIEAQLIKRYSQVAGVFQIHVCSVRHWPQSVFQDRRAKHSGWT